MNQQKSHSRQAKENLYMLFSRLASGLANPHRLELLDLLTQAPRTVEELAREAHMSVANTSQHLQRLRNARLVASHRSGLHVHYTLADPAVARLWLELRGAAEHQIAELGTALDDYRNQRRQFPSIGAAELLRMMSTNRIILLDVRPRVEYDSGHLPGAVSMPLTELKRRLSELPRDKTIVAYCRGPYCAYADQALSILSDAGWKVRRLEEGVLEWAQAGRPVEREPQLGAASL